MYLANVRSLLDRQRFEDAVDKGNVELGRWEKENHRYAKGLLDKGKKEDALGVLKQVISGSARTIRGFSVSRAVLLDAAGTLIRPREPVGETYAMVAGRYGAELEPDKLMHAFGEVFGQMSDLAFQWTSTDELLHLERDWWYRLVRRVVARTGADIDDFDGFFDALYEHYARGSAWECFPEVPAVLDSLRARGCQLAVVSNFDSRLPGILQALGIHDQMDAVVYSSEAGSAKPDPAIFRRALDELGVAPERTIHVGDNAKADVEGAVSAGLTGLLIQRARSLSAASVPTIRSLEELIVRVP